MRNQKTVFIYLLLSMFRRTKVCKDDIQGYFSSDSSSSENAFLMNPVGCVAGGSEAWVDVAVGF